MGLNYGQSIETKHELSQKWFKKNKNKSGCEKNVYLNILTHKNI